MSREPKPDASIGILGIGAADANRSQTANDPREPRRKVDLPAVLLFADNATVCVSVLDLSYDGCRIDCSLALLPGLTLTLSVLGLGKMPAYVRWYSNGFAGLSFRPEPIELVEETPREHERINLRAQILLRRSGVKGFYVDTTDISPTGCRVEFVERPSVGDRHWIKFEGLDALESTVRWVKGFNAGIEFNRAIYLPVFELLLARLR